MILALCIAVNLNPNSSIKQTNDFPSVELSVINSPGQTGEKSYCSHSREIGGNSFPQQIKQHIV